MKIFMFVEVATLSHRHEETGGFFKVLQGDQGSFTWIEKGCEWQEEWVDLLSNIPSDRTEILVL